MQHSFTQATRKDSSRESDCCPNSRCAWPTSCCTILPGSKPLACSAVVSDLSCGPLTCQRCSSPANQPLPKQNDNSGNKWVWDAGCTWPCLVLCARLYGLPGAQAKVLHAQLEHRDLLVGPARRRREVPPGSALQQAHTFCLFCI
jgi:hypothetical protein